MKSIALPFTLTALGLIVLLGVFIVTSKDSIGAGYLGFSVYQQSATTTTVGPTGFGTTIFSAKSDGSCKSRVIGTKTTPIVLLFGDPTNGDLASTTLTGTTGFVQGASTTVAYDSGTYGCGRWTAYAAASTTITVSEF